MAAVLTPSHPHPHPHPQRFRKRRRARGMSEAAINKTIEARKHEREKQIAIQPSAPKKMKKTTFIQSIPLNSSITVNKNYPFVFLLETYFHHSISSSI